MTDIIQLLPDSIANQIAAGEVVQRPASIVKELMENAMDAQAQAIKVIIKEAGKTLVQVIDDGIGMSETDARLSFERHATSKIRKTEDLFNIRTMGFRGEALASIAAVAQVELKTKRSMDDLGTLIQIEGSQHKSQETITYQIGTSLAVKNLFFNVPARRNFLKANPEIEFSLFHNDTEIYQIPAGKLSQRIVSIFGKNYQKQLVPCHEETHLLNVKGYIGRPEFAKKTRGEQFFFVNNRYIKHPYLHHAVVTAFENLITDNAHPFYVLFLEIDPQHIDINIHPTKTEVKFDDEKTIYAIVQSTIKKAISAYNLSPALDFEIDVNFDPAKLSEKTLHENNLYQGSGSGSFSKSEFNAKFDFSNQNKSQVKNWEKLYEGLQENTPEENADFQSVVKVDTETGELIFESSANQLDKSQLFQNDSHTLKERKTFQIHNRFIISQIKSGMMLIDQKYALERILFDKYTRLFEKKTASPQQLLFPMTLLFNSVDFEIILENEMEMRNLGFVFDILPQNNVLLKAVPSENFLGDKLVKTESEKELLEGLIEQLKNEQNHLTLKKEERMACALAKRNASRMLHNLSKEEMNALIDQLFASSNPNYSPDGKPTLKILSLEDIADLF
jgi:DNA mismatch repair protein MutL